ncbi:MAG: ATP-NAD kinase [Solirubrobacterales bacterium]|nr:MAG: ATP-NAD kinase [Solirubrobacterales bacterium]
MRRATVLTHRGTAQTTGALSALRDAAERHGVSLCFDPEETRKHGLEPGPGLIVDCPLSREANLCVTLGGDGTILRALRAYAGTGVPVFAVNFGELGFLATIEPEDIAAGFERAFRGDFEVLALPAIALSGPCGDLVAINDVSLHRRQGGRVAHLAYAVGDQEVGRVRCDGLVIATPAGSTGYNLANGGPVLAWGVEGFVVSFIAPHSLTARALVVAPGDPLSVTNRSRHEPADLSVDGMVSGELGPGERIEASFVDGQGSLAQIPGTSFYVRLRQKFGRLSS